VQTLEVVQQAFDPMTDITVLYLGWFEHVLVEKEKKKKTKTGDGVPSVA